MTKLIADTVALGRGKELLQKVYGKDFKVTDENIAQVLVVCTLNTSERRAFQNTTKPWGYKLPPRKRTAAKKKDADAGAKKTTRKKRTSPANSEATAPQEAGATS